MLLRRDRRFQFCLRSKNNFLKQPDLLGRFDKLKQDGIHPTLSSIKPVGVCCQVIDDSSSFVQNHPLVSQWFSGQNIVLRLGITHLGAYLFFPLFRLAFQVPVALGQQVQFSQTVRQLVLPLISQETDFFDGPQAASGASCMICSSVRFNGIRFERFVMRLVRIQMYEKMPKSVGLLCKKMLPGYGDDTGPDV